MHHVTEMSFPSGPSGSGIPENAAARNQRLYELFREEEEFRAAQIRRLNRAEALTVYEVTAKPFGTPVKTNVDPVLWSPASLKELASEALRCQIFVDQWVESGGFATFGKGRLSKFDSGVLRRITEEPYIDFKYRIKAWLEGNPRNQFPPLPESYVLSDDSSVFGVGALGPGNSWSIDDVVKNHRFYAASPGRRGGDTALDESDSSVEILEVKKKSKWFIFKPEMSIGLSLQK